MKGWHIFLHSVRLVFSNLGHALRVSLVLYLVQVAGQVARFLNPPQMQDIDGMPMPVMDPGLAVQSLVFGILALISSLWIAVAWHRFVLAEEYPAGWLPRWHGANMVNYLLRSLLLALLIGLAVTVAAIPFGFIAMGLPGAAWLVLAAMIGFGAYLFFRLAVMLPAAALGELMPVFVAWNATRGESGSLIALSIIVVMATLLVQLPSILNGDPGSVINLVYGLVVNWFATIVGISVLTTLYGHFIEQRPID